MAIIIKKIKNKKKEHSRRVGLFNSSQKALQYATRRQINSADGSIVEAEAPTKSKVFIYFSQTINNLSSQNKGNHNPEGGLDTRP